jgi:beta-glucuronidase
MRKNAASTKNKKYSMRAQTLAIPIVSLFLFFFSNHIVTAQNQLLINAYNRQSLSLNGSWHYIVDPYEAGYYDYRYLPYDQNPNPGADAFFVNYKAKNKSDRVEYDFDKSDTIQVPGDWNSQKEKLFYYEGTVWYERSFKFKKSKPENRVFMYFDAINYRADVYMNGKKLGVHEGGFTPFCFEVTNLLNDTGNFVVIKVDNKRLKEGVPTLNTDWWNYGGITRDVRLIEVPPTYIGDYFIQLDPKRSDRISGYVKLEGQDASSKTIRIKIPALDISFTTVANRNGIAPVDIRSSSITFWSPDNPFLYDVIVHTDEETVSDRIGFRTIATRGEDILLNGKPVFLRGVSIHEENPLRGGRAYSMDDATLLLTWAKELGCNYVRLAHYPHNENMVRLADEMGILVWEENPVYWTIQWSNKETFANAAHQLSDEIFRDKNRAAVIIWSMANETPVSDERLTFLKNLADTARRLDDTRLISAALEQHSMAGDELTRTIDDPFAKYVDVLAFNEYIGWYDGLPDECDRITWKLPHGKPVIISEFGGGALGGLHADSLTRWSEEYQEYLYRENLSMLDKIPQLRGMTPWILADFRSPRRFLPDIQDGWNRKGLISQTGEKKKAFYVLQKYYEGKK